MKDLLMVIPSRGRPHNIMRLMEAMEATCRADTSLVIGLDDDDPTVLEYPNGPVYDVAGGMRQVGPWLNYLTKYRTQGWEAIGHFGDDNLPKTDGWDERMLAALDRRPFAFGNDLYPRTPGSLPCHVFMRSAVIQALGYMCPPEIRHIADLAWRDWGAACGISYLDDVIIEHLHWSVGKAPMDDTYAAVNVADSLDQASYVHYRAMGLEEDVAKIRAVL